MTYLFARLQCSVRFLVSLDEPRRSDLNVRRRCSLQGLDLTLPSWLLANAVLLELGTDRDTVHSEPLV